MDMAIGFLAHNNRSASGSFHQYSQNEANTHSKDAIITQLHLSTVPLTKRTTLAFNCGVFHHRFIMKLETEQQIRDLISSHGG